MALDLSAVGEHRVDCRLNPVEFAHLNSGPLHGGLNGGAGGQVDLQQVAIRCEADLDRPGCRLRADASRDHQEYESGQDRFHCGAGSRLV